MSKSIIFGVLLAVALVTGFLDERYTAVDDIVFEATTAPLQTPAEENSVIRFSRDGYAFELTPLFEYDIRGLVLHTMVYDTWYSLSRTDKTFTKDLCMVWGDTLGAKSHQKLDAKQDSRWCWWSYSDPNLVAHSGEIANNHLIASSPEIERQIRAVGGGDQIRIYGKLVNVSATALGETKKYEGAEINWKTSTTRSDTGGGACEIIYVERIEVLKEGNTMWRLAHTAALIGLAVLAAWAAGQFTWEVLGGRRARRRSQTIEKIP